MRKDGAYIKSQRIKRLTKYILGESGKERKPVLLRTVTIYAEMEIGLSEYRALSYVQRICEAYEWAINGAFIVLRKPERERDG